MSFDKPFTKENLNDYLKELAKEFRKLNDTQMPAEIILIGGAAVLANYGFREKTYDVDAVIMASSAIKEAANHVGDRFGLENGWLNMDFQKTKSYSPRLSEVSVYYKTFSNILAIRTVSAEYLIAIKLMSGRQYKYDLSDIAGILWEHQKNDNPITREAIDKALVRLYGDSVIIPEVSRTFIDDAFANGNYERIYRDIRASEDESKSILLDFNKDYPRVLNEENTAGVLEKARQKRIRDEDRDDR